MTNLNSNIVVLIPKIPKEEHIDQYQSIALANLQFKIITKILANRLSIIAKKNSLKTKEVLLRTDSSLIAFALP